MIPGDTITKDNSIANEGMLYFLFAVIEVFKGRSGKGIIDKEIREEISPTKSADVFTTFPDILSGIVAEVAIKLKHFIV